MLPLIDMLTGDENLDTDNGVGMEKEFVDHLFSSNSIISTGGTNNEKGSGFGLVLCKDFVERNGGQIRVDSALGKSRRLSQGKNFYHIGIMPIFTQINMVNIDLMPNH